MSRSHKYLKRVGYTHIRGIYRTGCIPWLSLLTKFKPTKCLYKLKQNNFTRIKHFCITSTRTSNLPSFHYRIDTKNHFEPANTKLVKHLGPSPIIYQQRYAVYLGVSIRATGVNIINQPTNNVR